MKNGCVFSELRNFGVVYDLPDIRWVYYGKKPGLNCNSSDEKTLQLGIRAEIPLINFSSVFYRYPILSGERLKKHILLYQQTKKTNTCMILPRSDLNTQVLSQKPAKNAEFSNNFD